MAAISILIVDDETEFVDALGERLALRGIDSKGAYSGEEALKILEEQTFDVVLLDVMMPGIGGLATLKEIVNRKSDTSVILLSGHADINTAVEGMNLGAFDYLVKPVGLDELVYKIEDARTPSSG